MNEVKGSPNVLWQASFGENLVFQNFATIADGEQGLQSHVSLKLRGSLDLCTKADLLVHLRSLAVCFHRIPDNVKSQAVAHTESLRKTAEDAEAKLLADAAAAAGGTGAGGAGAAGVKQ
jgi:hypothetical protein